MVEMLEIIDQFRVADKVFLYWTPLIWIERSFKRFYGISRPPGKT